MNRVLVVQTAYLGDVVLSQPLWAAVKRRWPEAAVDVLVQPQWASLLTGDPTLHDVLMFDKRRSDRGLTGLLRLAQRLRARRYDAAFCPHPSFRSALLLALAGIPERVGFADSAGRWLFSTTVPRDRRAPEVERVMSLLAAFDVVPEAAPSPRLAPTPALTAQADDLFAAWELPRDRPFVCAHPGSVWATKRWTPAGFAAVLSDLADDGFTPVLLGGPDDAEAANAVQDRVREPAINLAGRLSLPEAALLLSRAALLATNDSGPMHIAGAVGTPVVAVFGSTVPALGYAPVGSPSRIVEKSLPCRPCGPHGWRRCPLDHFHCMRQLDPAAVTAACRALLAERGGSAAR